MIWKNWNVNGRIRDYATWGLPHVTGRARKRETWGYEWLVHCGIVMEARGVVSTLRMAKTACDDEAARIRTRCGG